MEQSYHKILQEIKLNNLFHFKDRISSSNHYRTGQNVLTDTEQILKSNEFSSRIKKRIFYIVSDFFQSIIKLSDYNEYIYNKEIIVSQDLECVYIYTSTDQYTKQGIERFFIEVEKLNNKTKTELKELYKGKLQENEISKKRYLGTIELSLKIDYPMLYNIMDNNSKSVLGLIYRIKR